VNATVEWELSPEGRELLFGPLEESEQAYREASWTAPEPEKRGRRKRSPVVNK
jgi:hypothetical protein